MLRLTPQECEELESLLAKRGEFFLYPKDRDSIFRRLDEHNFAMYFDVDPSYVLLRDEIRRAKDRVAEMMDYVRNVQINEAKKEVAALSAEENRLSLQLAETQRKLLEAKTNVSNLEHGY